MTQDYLRKAGKAFEAWETADYNLKCLQMVKNSFSVSVNCQLRVELAICEFRACGDNARKIFDAVEQVLTQERDLRQAEFAAM